MASLPTGTVTLVFTDIEGSIPSVSLRAGNRPPKKYREGLAGAAAGRGHYERAARLIGAAEASREALGRDRSAFEQSAHDRRVASTLAGLGGTAFAAAWAEGRAMTLEQAIEYALILFD
jgi:hypothetical protein